MVREACDLQQMQVARAVTATEKAAKSFGNYLSRIERGDERNPSLEMLAQIATGLGLTLSDFFLQIARSQNEVLQISGSERTMTPSSTSHEATAHAVGERELPPAARALFDSLEEPINILERHDVERRLRVLEATLRREERQRKAAENRGRPDAARRKESHTGKSDRGRHRKTG